MSTTTEFWVVWNPYKGLPQVRHDTQAAAEAEADRLAAKHPGDEFIVLRAESVTKAEVPKPTRVNFASCWILHDGKSKPDFPAGTMLHFRYRGGVFSASAGTSLDYPRGEPPSVPSRWIHSGDIVDVVAYKVVR